MTGVVLTDLSGDGAIVVGLTHERWRATTCEALPRGRTICLARTCGRHAVAKITALVCSAILVDATVGASLAEEAVAHGASGTICVDGALPEVDAAIAQALEAWLTILIVHAVHVRDAGA